MAGPTKAELLRRAAELGVTGVDETSTNAAIQEALDSHESSALAAAAAAGNGPDDRLDLDAELAAEAAAAAAVENLQDDGTVWFSVGCGMINVNVGSVVYDRLLTDGAKPVPAPED